LAHQARHLILCGLPQSELVQVTGRFSTQNQITFLFEELTSYSLRAIKTQRGLLSPNAKVQQTAAEEKFEIL
jgi:hypothetical protein